jgi:GT2 family glycosyltransferase
MSSATRDVKAIATGQAQSRLREFLESGLVLHLPRPSSPQLSILLVLYNRAELTLACLRSLLPRLAGVRAEIVLVDNASGDETALLLDRIRGATILRNRDNRGFPAGVNQAASAASGEFLLLLNNDTEVLDDSPDAALRFLAENPDVGAVGGRVLLLDGTLQEAGCVLGRDGHSAQYGRGDSPEAPEYQFRRDVDYCSAAFLMTRRDLFHKLGGLDVSFSPGYFEDADYGIRLWRAGWRVVYLPEVAIVHYENASSTCRQSLHRLCRRNHAFFLQKHADWLAWKLPSAGTCQLWARSSHDDRFRVLYISMSRAGDTPREPAPRLQNLVRELRALNCFVTVYPLDPKASGSDGEAVSLPADVEVMAGGSLGTLSDFLTSRRGYYELILVSDPEVCEWVRQLPGPVGRVFPTSIKAPDASNSLPVRRSA